MQPTIVFDDFAGATAEAGQPDADSNPFAPASSRAVGDAFVHYIEHLQSQQDVIRFWFPENPDGDVMPVDYEILQASISGPNGDQVLVDDDVATKLLVRVFFQEHCQDSYSERIASFSFKRLANDKAYQIPYPARR